MISQTATTSFKQELPLGIHDFSADTFYLALYTGDATLDATTTVYTTSNEVSGGGYVAGGEALTVNLTPTATDGIIYWSFADVTWASASFTARGGLIYNSSKANRSVAVLNFGADKTGGGTFTVQFPAATATTAILRIE